MENTINNIIALENTLPISPITPPPPAAEALSIESHNGPKHIDGFIVYGPRVGITGLRIAVGFPKII